MLHFTRYRRKRLSKALAKAGPVVDPAFIFILLDAPVIPEGGLYDTILEPLSF